MPGRRESSVRNDDPDLGLPFDQMIDRYQRRVYGAILDRVQDAEAAADLTQETFVAAYRAWGEFAGDGPVATWLARIA
jgi:RNA polymerase sigma-70 factor, ECF subfamily